MEARGKKCSLLIAAAIKGADGAKLPAGIPPVARSLWGLLAVQNDAAVRHCGQPVGVQPQSSSLGKQSTGTRGATQPVLTAPQTPQFPLSHAINGSISSAASAPHGGHHQRGASPPPQQLERAENTRGLRSQRLLDGAGVPRVDSGAAPRSLGALRASRDQARCRRPRVARGGEQHRAARSESHGGTHVPEPVPYLRRRAEAASRRTRPRHGARSRGGRRGRDGAGRGSGAGRGREWGRRPGGERGLGTHCPERSPSPCSPLCAGEQRGWGNAATAVGCGDGCGMDAPWDQ